MDQLASLPLNELFDKKSNDKKSKDSMKIMMKTMRFLIKSLQNEYKDNKNNKNIRLLEKINTVSNRVIDILQVSALNLI